MSRNKIDELIETQTQAKERRLEGQIQLLQDRNKRLLEAIERQKKLWAAEYQPTRPKKGKPSGSKYFYRLLLGDTHGCHINIPARDALLADLDLIGSSVEQTVYGGDMQDCAGTYTRFKKIHLREFAYTVQDDNAAANDLLDQVQKRTPNSEDHELEGNHEYRIIFWAIEQFQNAVDAKMVLEMLGPRATLHLDKRGIKYYDSHECYMGLNKPGMIQLGKCKFIHGGINSLHATYAHVMESGDNIVHWHNHRNTSIIIRTPDKEAVGGFGVPCLCELQPYYFHYQLAKHTHGYAIQIVNRKTHNFQHISVPIIKGRSMLSQFRDSLVQV